ncbi:MAG: LysR family transcriptional regulator [Oribacterium sp.]
MDVKACHYLLALEEQRSISAAARALGLSQPALSKFLSLTERQLGQQLFIRSSPLLPTEAGRIYLSACREILNVRQRSYASIFRLGTAPQQILTIGVTPYRGSRVFSEIFPSFTERFPHVQLHLRECYMREMKEAIRRGELDLSLGTLTSEDETHLCFASSSYEELCLSVPLSHPAASGSDDSATLFPTTELQRFSDAPFVMWGAETTNARVIESYMSRFHFSPTVIYTGNNALLVNELLKTGIGVGLIPRSFCKPHENRVYFSLWPPVQTFIGIFYQKERILSPAERYFIFLVLRNAAESGMDIYYNKLSRGIIREFGG